MKNLNTDFTQKRIKWGLLFLNILFLGYFVILSFYNRLSQDDYLFLKSVETNGILNFIKDAYLFQSGRFIAYLYNAFLYSIIEQTSSIYFIPILIWLFCFFTLYYTLSLVVTINDKLFMTNLSALVLNIFIITNFEFTAYFWICANFNYVLPVLGLLFIVLIIKNKISNYQFFLLFFISIILSGSSEVFVPLFLLFLTLFFYFNFRIHSKIFLIDINSKKIIISFLILLIGLIVIVIAPGNYNRATEVIFQRPDSIFEFIIITLKSFLMFFYLLSFKFPYYIILTLISFYVGYQNRDKFTFQFNYTRFLSFSWVSYFLFILFSVMPAAFLMSGFGFHRIYTTTLFFSIIFFLVQSFILGLKINKNINLKLFQHFISINLLIFTIAMFVNLYLDVPTAKAYSQSDKARTNLLLKFKKENHKELVELETLHKPYTINLKYIILRKKQPMLYYENEISTDTTGYVNSCLRSFYELDFPIKLKSDR